jgi:hypothetical protein
VDIVNPSMNLPPSLRKLETPYDPAGFPGLALAE